MIIAPLKNLPWIHGPEKLNYLNFRQLEMAIARVI
jgi:hypothetical protein